jgi:hypothetical protein
MLAKIRNPENQDFLSCRSAAAAAEVEEEAAAAAGAAGTNSLIFAEKKKQKLVLGSRANGMKKVQKRTRKWFIWG